MQYGLYLNWYGFLFRDFILKLLFFVDQFLDQCITTFEFDGHGFESLYDIYLSEKFQNSPQCDRNLSPSKVIKVSCKVSFTYNE